MSIESRLKFCACCPAPCRSVVPEGVKLHDETGTPSSLSLIALAVMAGDLILDDSVRHALANNTAAKYCVAACTYGHDVVTDIGEWLRTHGDDGTARKVTAAERD